MAMGPGDVQGRSWKAKPTLPLSLDKINKGCLENTTYSITRQSETDGQKSRSLQLSPEPFRRKLRGSTFR